MISVCMATYNGGAYIREQLQSILNQTLPADEVILCDDGSVDATAEIAAAFIEEHGLAGKWQFIVNPRKKGYPGNQYHCMSLCNGEYVFLADQDDIWDAHKLERMTAILKSDNKVSVLSCKFGLIDERGKMIRSILSPVRSGDTGKTHAVTISDVFYKCEWPGMVLAYRREWYEQKLGSFRQRAEVAAFLSVPHDLLLCAWAAEEGAFCQLDDKLAFHRRHDHNTGGEEHRIGRLLSRERKIKEIKGYLHILQQFEEQQILQTEEGNYALNRKKTVMEERHSALESGTLKAVLSGIWTNRSDTRIATAVCDLLIALLRRK